MRHLKIYEEYQEELGEPEVGMYVICDTIEDGEGDLSEFLLSNIGEIIAIKNNTGSLDFYIYYNNLIEDYALRNYYSEIVELDIDDNIIDNVVCVNRREIKHFSFNKNDLSVYIDAKKYNL